MGARSAFGKTEKAGGEVLELRRGVFATPPMLFITVIPICYTADSVLIYEGKIAGT